MSSLGANRRKLTMVAVSGLAAIVVALAANNAGAEAFSGPWYQGDEPATISNPAISFYGETDGDYVGQDGGFEFYISSSISCPNGTALPITVVFSDPSGSITDTLTNGCPEQEPDGAETNSGTWTSVPSNGSLDFLTGPGVRLDPSAPPVNGLPVQEPVDELDPASDPAGDAWNTEGLQPFVFTVSDSTGVLAQGGYSSWYTQPTDGEPGTRYYRLGMWPAAPTPTPTPTTTTSTPTPTPTPEPKPKPLPKLTLAATTRYARIALSRKLRGIKGLKGTCASKDSDTRQNCNVSLTSKGNVRWTGTVDIWYSRTTEGVEWNYSLNLAGRTPSCKRPSCAKRITVH